MKIAFSDQYKHPLWQKRRLQILDTHGWQCNDCGSSEKTLHVHHKQYFKDRMLWEYSDDELVALCDECHKSAHHVLDRIKEILVTVDTVEAFALLAGYFGRFGEINPGVVEEARQMKGLEFASGFVASLSQHSIEEIYRIGEFSTRNNPTKREVLNKNMHVFGK